MCNARGANGVRRSNSSNNPITGSMKPNPWWWTKRKRERGKIWSNYSPVIIFSFHRVSSCRLPAVCRCCCCWHSIRWQEIKRKIIFSHTRHSLFLWLDILLIAFPYHSLPHPYRHIDVKCECPTDDTWLHYSRFVGISDPFRSGFCRNSRRFRPFLCCRCDVVSFCRL